MNEHDSKLARSIVWAVCVLLCTLVISANAYWTWRDTTAINAGLHQVPQSNGGYWVKDQSP